jgi:Kef-type K+ transport system membrane component KefB
MAIFSTALPLHEPLLIFTTIMGIVLLSPFVFRLVKIPDVATFIIMGVLIGPSGFNILAKDSSIELLGTVGLLYIMFLAGLELDPEKLKISRKNSVVFGFATFIFPFVLGLFVSKNILRLEQSAALLVSIMFATHTLVAYPIARKLGINSNVAVLTAIGGTIITDTIVLLFLSIATQNFQNSSVGLEILKLLLYFGFYTFFIFYSFPKIARWFFKYIKRDRPVHYLFLLFMVCISSLVAEFIGTEPIIGAFIAGLALNRSIPKNSLLMHHVDFVGNVLFIPVFLVSIGMLFDTRVLVSGTKLWYVSLVLIATALTGKWLAAFFAQKVLKFSSVQRKLLFGLTSSHAAATIAIILIGYEKHIIDITIFNATIFVILVSSLVASFITEQAGKTIALNSSTLAQWDRTERILVPISNPLSMANLLSIATSFQKLNQTEPVYVLNILNENRSSRENILKIRESLEKNVAEFNNLNENLKVITRVDLSISSGIMRAAKEHMATDIVFGWGEKSTTSQRLFGNIFDHLLNGQQTLFAINITGKLVDYNKFVVHLPSKLEYDQLFIPVVQKLNTLPKPDDQVVFVMEDDACLSKIRAILPKRNKHKVTYTTAGFCIPDNKNGAINILFLLRKQSVSYKSEKNVRVQKILSNPNYRNQIVVVPGYE